MGSIGPAESMWLPSDLLAISQGDLRPADATILMRSDYATGTFYPGKINVLFGAPESGKTWVAMATAIDVALTNSKGLEDDVSVLVLDYEDSEKTFVRRLMMMRAHMPTMGAQIAYHGLSVSLKAIPLDLPGLDTAQIIIIDTTNSAMSRMGLDPLSNADANEFMDAVVDLKARAAPGAAILLIDHEPIATSSMRRNAIGAQSKFARIDGVQMRTSVIEQPRPGHHGAIALKLTKDREGGIRAHAGRPNAESGIQHHATMLMFPRGDEESDLLHHESSFHYIIKGPRTEEGAADEKKDAIIAALGMSEKLMSKNQIIGIVGGNKTRTLEIIDAMHDEGEIYAEPKGNHVVFGVVPSDSAELDELGGSDGGNHTEPML